MDSTPAIQEPDRSPSRGNLSPTPGESAGPGAVRKACPPIIGGNPCCPVVPGEKPCCKPRKAPADEEPPGEGPTEMPELVDEDTLTKLKEAYENTHANMYNRSLMKKYLSRAVFDALKYKKTKSGSTLLDVIRSGSKCPDSIIGAYAPDGESYNKFAKLFNPIIWEYHKGFSPKDQHPPSNWGNPASLPNIEPCEGIIHSVYVKCCRNVEGFPLMRHMTEEQFAQFKEKVLNAFGKLEGELQGDYEPHAGMTDDYSNDLVKNHLLFKLEDRFLEEALAMNLEKSRGIFLNKDRTFLVWVGMEDHLQIISLQKGGAVAEVYSRLIDGVKQLEMHLQFQKHPRLGYITMCPSNLGNTIRASVIAKLPYSGYDDEELRQKARKLNLEVRDPDGEQSKDCVHEISNQRKVGVTEFNSVNEMVLGIKEIIKMERAEQKNSSKTAEEMSQKQQELQETKAKDRERDRHRRFARRNPDGTFSEHQDPRLKDKDRDRSRRKDRGDRPRGKEGERDKPGSRDRDKDRSKSRARRDREKEKMPRDEDRPPRSRDEKRTMDSRDRKRDDERPKSADKSRDERRLLEPGTKDRDREKKKEKMADEEKRTDEDRRRDREKRRERERGKTDENKSESKPKLLHSSDSDENVQKRADKKKKN